MIKVVLLGYGNVGKHMFDAFSSSSKAKIVQVYNRSKKELPSKIPQTESLKDLCEADLYLIASSDDSIVSISGKIPFHDTLVVHTSGSVAMDSISANHRRGIFYPLQTFSKDRSVDFAEIPICIEAESNSDLELLRQLGTAISNKVVEVDSSTREKLHLAAVFVNNFSNHLYHISEEILTKYGLDFDLLKPLLLETALKVQQMSPKEAQTGPARRQDSKTLEKHLHLLDDPLYRTIYKDMTQSIQATYGKKL
ncbi:MAG: DUF2520 domain-containing protein [Flavobacteriaceae bacterium]|nr:DUF2520 domain-containing protein [Flavobacteriaceae bacterium]